MKYRWNEISHLNNQYRFKTSWKHTESFPFKLFLYKKVKKNLFNFPEPIEEACPKGCKCNNEFASVDCSNQTLVQIPKNLPQNTVQLNLSHNLLTTLIVSDLVNLKELQQLFVTDNHIEIIVDTDVSIVEMFDQNKQLAQFISFEICRDFQNCPACIISIYQQMYWNH